MDAADIAEENRARAMELFENKRQERIYRQSMQPLDPKKPRYCQDCRRRISKTRLAAAPCTARCTQCADAIERNRFV